LRVVGHARGRALRLEHASRLLGIVANIEGDLGLFWRVIALVDLDPDAGGDPVRGGVSLMIADEDQLAHQNTPVHPTIETLEKLPNAAALIRIERN
jgi:hypothetical protein